MDDIFKKLPFVFVYIDDLLVCSSYARSHHSHLKGVFDLLLKHGLVLSKSKLCWTKTKIEYLGLILSRGSVELQDHVLKKLSEFPDEIMEKKQLQRFLGCINYICQFYENQAKDDNNRILRWSLWLDGFDFDIHYKSRKENCIADLLTREAAPTIREINKWFHPP
jgi:hypothetical protein